MSEEKIAQWREKLNSLLGRTGARVKVPTILQMEATECGAASLAMILAHYGLWLPLEKLRQECGVDRDGSKASSVIKAARARGCEAHGYRWPPDIIREAEYPLIIHWEFNHFVVLEGVKGDVVYLNDPAMGRRTVPWEEFRTSYTGVSLDVRPGEGFVREGHRYNVFADIFRKLLADRVAAAFVLILGLCMIIPGLAAPVFQQIFIDDILTRKHPDWMFSLCVGMTISFVLSGVMTWLRAVTLTYWQRKLTLADSSRYFWHILKLPLTFFQQRYAAEVASRIGFTESIASVLSGSAATAVLDLFVALFYLALLLQYNVELTIIGVAFSLLSLGMYLGTRRHLTDLSMRIQQDVGKEYGTAINGLGMIESLKANGDEQDFFAKWAGYHVKVLAAQQEQALWSLRVNMLPTLFGGLNTALIMAVGGFSIMDGLLTAGMFTAFQTLMGGFQTPFNKLIGLGTSLQTTEMQLQRLNDVERYQPDTLNYPEVEGTGFSGVRLSGDLELRDVTFGFSPLSPPLIEDFSLHIGKGRWVALVGASGSGKSTIAKVVTGLYEEWSGEVLLDGVRRRDIPRRAVVASLAAVDQDIFLLSGTVRENIALFDTSVSRADVMQAAKDACIHDDIMNLEGSYEYQVSEGGQNFSGGQRQRLEIARALVKNPSILVLDEATSALDPVTEQKVLTNIRRRGCSCLVVAHRLSTIRDCDEIIMLERGSVVERGTHRELMAAQGAYYDLIREQAREGGAAGATEIR